MISKQKVLDAVFRGVTVVLLFCVTVVLGDALFAILRNPQNQRTCVTSAPNVTVTEVKSQGHCAMLCVLHLCHGFNFWNDSHLCQIFLFTPNCTQSNVDNCLYYEKNPFQRIPVNLALHRPASSSSAYVNGVPLVAAFAVDGSDIISIMGMGANQHCFQTNDITGGPNWFYVDLGVTVVVDYVIVTNRDDGYGYRLDQFIIGVTDKQSLLNPPIRGAYPLCGEYPYPAKLGERITLKCAEDTPPGRYVIAQQPATGAGNFEFCEIEVYAKCQ